MDSPYTNLNGPLDLPAIHVAGAVVHDPWGRLVHYAEFYGKTMRRYDFAGNLEDPNILTREVVRSTRVIGSRISDKQVGWFVQRARSAPWHAVSPTADLYAADPADVGGAYDAADALYRHFRSPSQRGIRTAKVSKVLHLMRPELVPVLDSRLVKTYRLAAKNAAKRYRGPRHEPMYWAAIRDDLIANRAAIEKIKEHAAGSQSDQIARLAKLSDLQILDIVTWSS